MVLATSEDTESKRLVELGAYLEPVYFNRGGLSPSSDVKTFICLRNVYRNWRPSLIQHFHAKPIIFGSFAARQVLGNSARVVNTITGLGHAFANGGLVLRSAELGYRVALRKAKATIFQNRDDQALFLRNGWVDKERARLVTSSGVDTSRFAFIDRRGRDSQAPVVIMLGRLLSQKGITDFVEAARRIRRHWPKARFVWAGEEDPVHPDAVSGKWLKAQEAVEYVGWKSDVVPLLSRADLLLFPSSYREGVPRVVLEAASTGLPTVGFDVPGVREAVQNGETGFLVSERDMDVLVLKLEKLLKDETLRFRMGQKARALVEECFEVRFIQEKYLNIYRELGIEI